MWVGDLKLTAFGQTQGLVQSYPGVVASFIEGFEQVGLKVSRGGAGSPGGKTKTVASSKKLEASLREPMRQLGIQVAEATVYLGLDLKRAGKRNARQHKRVVRFEVESQEAQAGSTSRASSLELSMGSNAWACQTGSLSSSGRQQGGPTAQPCRGPLPCSWPCGARTQHTKSQQLRLLLGPAPIGKREYRGHG